MKKTCAVLAALGLFAGSAALAQEDATEVEAEEFLEPVDDMSEYEVSLNGGVGGYLGQLSDFTGIGPVWGVNLNGKVTRGIGWELGYNGARTPITDQRIEDGSAAWRNGLHGMAKVFVPNQSDVQPFAGLGIGASYINVSEGAEGLYQNDVITELPVAAGVEYNSGGLTAGLRAMYRFQAGEEFAATATDEESPEGGLLTGQLTLGGVF